MALGYLSGSNSDRAADRLKAEVLPDIKNKMALVVKFEKARELTLDGKLEEAIACFERAIEYDPNSAVASSQRQALIVQIGRNRKTIGQSQKLVGLEPSSFDACISLVE